ncbi:probable CCR4-associated factor 1 homolog 7 [Phoenix dactylifera]|uniref:poly(A)-specific ribonuclease n=1 Tax=Phoenix dactylifera TaxID=42345 RepID=A0A8B7BKW3_PHODC|nr:probable CCR4-associated factor 1 homolog 7 [Phoenix dactylifera]
MSIPAKNDDPVEIREVWAHNLEAEMAVIREIVDEYPFVALDTEFPGVVITPVRDFKNNADENYQKARANVDLLHVIQIGFTFSDASGCLPPSPSGVGRPCVWQFNFREFDADRHFCNPASIDLLRRSGIDFQRNREWGVHALRFAELLMSSGVVLNDSVQWIAFHGAYDFAYLLKILTCRRLPETTAGFMELVRTFFPTVYDIKHLMKFCNNLYGGLANVAEQLDAERIGASHQAGSDSLLTAHVFWRLKEKYFGWSIERYAGPLYGL